MKPSHKTIFVLLISFIVSSVIDEYIRISQGISDASYVVHAFFIAACVLIWCKQHAKENEQGNLKYYPLFCALLPPIGISVYAFKFFGVKRGMLLVLKAAGAFIVAVTLMLAGNLFTRMIYV